MIARGPKNCNSTAKAKQAVMDVAYCKWLKGSTANVWVGDRGAPCVARDLLLEL